MGFIVGDFGIRYVFSAFAAAALVGGLVTLLFAIETGGGSSRNCRPVPAAGTYRLRIGYSTAGEEAERRAQIPAGHLLRVDDGDWQRVVYAPTQFREMVRQVTAIVRLPAGTWTLMLAKSNPDVTGEIQPGTVDLDYVDVELAY